MTTRAQHTPGPWDADHCTAHTQDNDPGYFQIDGPTPKGLNNTIPYTVADTMNRHFCVDPDEDRANARLIAAAPAQEVILQLLRRGLARFEPATDEFCFDGLRYSARDDWSGLLDVIGWDKTRAALTLEVGVK